MKNLFLILIAFFTLASLCAQDNTNNLIGKWKLQSIEAEGVISTTKEAFQTSEVHQVYKKSEFVGLIGRQVTKGSWKFSKDKKVILIAIKGEKLRFNIKSLKKDRMILELKNKEKITVLNYHKVADLVVSNLEVLNTNFEVLDANKDGIINPYEALDVLLSIQKETGSDLSLKNMTGIIAAYNNKKQQDNDGIFEELDKNNNNIIEMSEATEEMMQFSPLMDVDGSQSVTKEEVANFNFENVFFLSDSQLKEEVEIIFKQFLGSKEAILIKEVPKEMHNELTSWDENKDGEITKQEAFNGMKPGVSAVQFKIEGNVAYMTGTIGSSTPAVVLELIFVHPNVKTIEMINVPGSVDDVANLRASLYVHKFGLNTRLNSKSFIASGGTDFFLAGHKREIEKGAKIGVHSWSGGSKPAMELPKTDAAHKKYLDYYNKVNIPESFYWYTLEASPANSIHNMTEKEIVKYNVRTN